MRMELEDKAESHTRIYNEFYATITCINIYKMSSLYPLSHAHSTRLLLRSC